MQTRTEINHKTEQQPTIQLGPKVTQSELPINAFIEGEQLIRSTFDRKIGAATGRRDHLLVHAQRRDTNQATTNGVCW